MIAIKVIVNGNVKFIAGAEDLSILTAIVSVGSMSLGGLHYSVGGLSYDGALKEWDQFEKLNIGDSITFEILKTDVVNKPLHTKKLDYIK